MDRKVHVPNYLDRKEDNYLERSGHPESKVMRKGNTCDVIKPKLVGGIFFLPLVTSFGNYIIVKKIVVGVGKVRKMIFY